MISDSLSPRLPATQLRRCSSGCPFSSSFLLSFPFSLSLSMSPLAAVRPSVRPFSAGAETNGLWRLNLPREEGGRAEGRCEGGLSHILGHIRIFLKWTEEKRSRVSLHKIFQAQRGPNAQKLISKQITASINCFCYTSTPLLYVPRSFYFSLCWQSL